MVTRWLTKEEFEELMMDGDEKPVPEHIHAMTPADPDWSGRDVWNSGWTPGSSVHAVEADKNAPWTTQSLMAVPGAMVAAMLRALGGTFSLTFSDFESYDGYNIYLDRMPSKEAVVLTLAEEDEGEEGDK